MRLTKLKCLRVACIVTACAALAGCPVRPAPSREYQYYREPSYDYSYGEPPNPFFVPRDYQYYQPWYGYSDGESISPFSIPYEDDRRFEERRQGRYEHAGPREGRLESREREPHDSRDQERRNEHR